MLWIKCSLLVRSLIMMRNKIGPIQARVLINRELPTRTWNVLTAMKFLIQITWWSAIFRAASLAYMILDLTTSKALLKFKRHRLVYEPSPVASETTFTTLSRLVRCHRSLNNPGALSKSSRRFGCKGISSLMKRSSTFQVIELRLIVRICLVSVLAPF